MAWLNFRNHWRLNCRISFTTNKLRYNKRFNIDYTKPPRLLHWHRLLFEQNVAFTEPRHQRMASFTRRYLLITLHFWSVRFQPQSLRRAILVRRRMAGFRFHCRRPNVVVFVKNRHRKSRFMALLMPHFWFRLRLFYYERTHQLIHRRWDFIGDFRLVHWTEKGK